MNMRGVNRRLDALEASPSERCPECPPWQPIAQIFESEPEPPEPQKCKACGWVQPGIYLVIVRGCAADDDSAKRASAGQEGP
jgi:hypothetical protein